MTNVYWNTIYNRANYKRSHLPCYCDELTKGGNVVLVAGGKRGRRVDERRGAVDSYRELTFNRKTT
ncbi:hypothetical protein J6590_084610, partial [Homalodisca vitripennis]